MLELLSRAKRVAQRKVGGGRESEQGLTSRLQREREQAKDPEPLQFRSSKKTRLVLEDDD